MTKLVQEGTGGREGGLIARTEICPVTGRAKPNLLRSHLHWWW